MPEYNIKVLFEQKIFSFLCSEDQDVISASKMNGIDLPNTCFSGVHTSYASMEGEGSVDQGDVIGLNDDLRGKGLYFCVWHILSQICKLLLANKLKMIYILINSVSIKNEIKFN